MPGPWQAFYQSDLQGLWAPIALPLGFLLWLGRARPPRAGIEPRRARFVARYVRLFAIETIVDPVVTGPVVRALGVTGGLADYAMVPFVLLGDFRVFLLVLALAPPERAVGNAVVRGAAWTLVVPALAWVATRALTAAVGPLPGSVLWLVYECAFALLALGWRARVLPGQLGADRPALRAYCDALLRYVAAYYLLWAAADVLILGGHDLGWALRILPNLLYYALWAPFVWVRFFAARYAVTSVSTHAAR